MVLVPKASREVVERALSHIPGVAQRVERRDSAVIDGFADDVDASAAAGEAMVAAWAVQQKRPGFQSMQVRRG
jgi:hypothetical protein